MVAEKTESPPRPKPEPGFNPLAQGILPDPVIRDPRADATLVFARLDAGLDRDGVTSWLKEVTALVTDLTKPTPLGRVAAIACGFGPSFFLRTDGPRFGLTADRIPADFAELPTVTVSDPLANTDVAFYIMSTSAAAVARFLQGLAATRPALVGVTTARGFQRDDRRELGGFPDGLRNTTSANRVKVVFVDREEAPQEPDWLEDGTYMVYLRVKEDLERLAAMSVEDQEKVVGRRKDDGSRLDLPAGTAAKDEGAITEKMPAASHTPKAGPRGDHDSVAIFRRGAPFLDLAPDGSVVGGLHFVSFQSTLANFETILNRWILNPGFPTSAAGVDALFAQGLATIERSGFFVVPPADPRFIGAGVFDPPRPPVHDIGRLIVHKKVVDANGAPALIELGGIGFQVFGSDGKVIGPVFNTRSNGVAISPDLPMNLPLVLREVTPPANTDPATDLNFTLTRRRDLQVVVNHKHQPGPYGG